MGFETPTSASVDRAGAYGPMRAAIRGSGSVQKPPREQTDAAAVMHVFGATMNADAVIAGTSGNLIVTGSALTGSLTVSGNQSADVTIPSGETRDYVVALVGYTIAKELACGGNDPRVTDFGAANTVAGAKSGQCASL